MLINEKRGYELNWNVVLSSFPIFDGFGSGVEGTVLMYASITFKPFVYF